MERNMIRVKPVALDRVYSIPVMHGVKSDAGIATSKQHLAPISVQFEEQRVKNDNDENLRLGDKAASIAKVITVKWRISFESCDSQ